MAKISNEMRLYDDSNQRLYINAEERDRFLKAAGRTHREKQMLCITLLCTGCRISEALGLRIDNIQIGQRIITFRTLKRRKKHITREVPIPEYLADKLDNVFQIRQLQCQADKSDSGFLWESENRAVNRSTAYRWVKSVMRDAEIFGPQATPKGLRHGFGIQAIRNGIQLGKLQKWMGHADMRTTAIYTNAIGPEERELADKMWAEVNFSGV